MMNKKIMILILCLAVMVVVSGCWRKEKKQPIIVNNEQKIEEIEQEKAEKIGTSTEEIDIFDWQIYQGKVYSLSFPNNFTLSKNPLSGEQDIILQPENSPTYNYPSLNITYLSSSGTSLELQKNMYLNWSYTNKVITKQLVNGKNVWTLIGRLPNKVINGMIVDCVVNVKNIIFRNDDNIFIFSIQYEDKDSDTAKIFDKIIDSFKLK